MKTTSVNAFIVSSSYFCFVILTLLFAKLIVENDVDGEILLADVDHEALKNEFKIPSFGIRCKIINQILTLRGM